MDHVESMYCLAKKKGGRVGMNSLSEESINLYLFTQLVSQSARHRKKMLISLAEKTNFLTKSRK